VEKGNEGKGDIVRKFGVIIGVLLAGYITLLAFYVPHVKQEAHTEGFDDGWDSCTLSGSPTPEKNWSLYMTKYGSIKDTPWEEFTIKEKMLLCAYGSSGNKLSSRDMFKVFRKYGTETAAADIVDYSLGNTILICPNCGERRKWGE
jgi:hypothetical protein